MHYRPKVAVSKPANSLQGVPARRIRLGGAAPGRRRGESSPARSTAPSCTGTRGPPAHFSASCGHGAPLTTVHQHLDQ
ncbi:hypothetical protein [Streptomyces sp. TP-A0874]|uniref:hypothetical protein n=1 Tax=Streptomyces sp. TP-A0874 TaxID=549819 RepID=UPI0035B54B22